MHTLISLIIFYKLYSVTTPRHLELLLLENHGHIIVFTPNLQRVSFYNIIDFLHHRSTTKHQIVLSIHQISLIITIPLYNVPQNTTNSILKQHIVESNFDILNYHYSVELYNLNISYPPQMCTLHHVYEYFLPRCLGYGERLLRSFLTR